MPFKLHVHLLNAVPPKWKWIYFQAQQKNLIELKNSTEFFMLLANKLYETSQTNAQQMIACLFSHLIGWYNGCWAAKIGLCRSINVSISIDQFEMVVTSGQNQYLNCLLFMDLKYNYPWENGVSLRNSATFWLAPCSLSGKIPEDCTMLYTVIKLIHGKQNHQNHQHFTR